VYIITLIQHQGFLFSRQEEIFEQPGFTGVNEYCEPIFDVPSRKKAKVLERIGKHFNILEFVW